MLDTLDILIIRVSAIITLISLSCQLPAQDVPQDSFSCTGRQALNVGLIYLIYLLKSTVFAPSHRLPAWKHKIMKHV